MEDELVRSMVRRNREGDGVFRKTMAMEASRQSVAVVGPSNKSVDEDTSLGPGVEACPISDINSRRNIVGTESPIDSSPEFPPVLKLFMGYVGSPMLFNFRALL